MKLAKLGEVARIFNGNSISVAEKEKHYRGAVGMPYVGTAEVGFDAIVNYESDVAIPANRQTDFKIAKSGTALVCAEGGSAGRKVGFLERDVCFGNKLFAIEPQRGWDGKFLFYYCLSNAFRNQFRALTTGLIGGVSIKKFKEIEVPRFDYEKQRRIVAVLDEAFAAIAQATANAEKNLANARELFDRKLQSIFAERNGNWHQTTLEKLLAVQPRNGWSPPAAHHADSGTPVLTLSSVTGFAFRPDKIKFTSSPTDPTRSYWVENGDLLITRSNTPALVGHVAIAENITKPTIYPDLIMRMKPLENCALSKFLYYQLRAPVLRKEIMGRAQGANPTMLKLSNGAVRTLPIYAPPVAEQMQIVDTLEAMASASQDLTDLYKSKIAALAALKQSLLRRAFTGELTATPELTPA